MNRMHNFFNGGGGSPFGRLGNVMKVIGQFREFMANPLGAILGSGLDIPQNIQSNPEAITNYLRSSGKMTDDQYQQASEMAQIAQSLFGKKF